MNVDRKRKEKTCLIRWNGRQAASHDLARDWWTERQLGVGTPQLISGVREVSDWGSEPPHLIGGQ